MKNMNNNYLKVNKIFPIKSFDLNNENLKLIIQNIEKQLEILNKHKNFISRNRCSSIIIEEPKNIGKTEFVISFIHSLKKKFNYMDGTFNFDNYNQNAEVDIFKNLTINDFYKRNFFTSLFISNQRLTNIDIPYKKIIKIMKFKLSIILINSENSFQEQLKMQSKSLQDIIITNIKYIQINENKNLYIKK